MSGEYGRRFRLLLVDDHPVLRAGLKALLSDEPDLVVSAEAGSAVEAIEASRDRELDLVLMDVSLRGSSGADATRHIKELRPELPVLALSVHEEIPFVRMLLDAGASGYALKRSACDELVRAVRVVVGGNSYLDPAIARQLISVGQRRHSTSGTPLTVALSERELEVMRLMAQGLTMKEIAAQLSLSPRTLETYRARAMEKLSLKTRADLVRYAIRCGWLAAS